MLEQVLTHLNNWFEGGIYEGTFVIRGGSITLPFLQTGQYFRVCGSVFNDGLHQYPDGEMEDESFDGQIWALRVPRSVIALSQEIEQWQEKNGAIAAGPYQSESFGGYTYSKATDSQTGGAATWESTFRRRLNAWRRI